MKIIHPEMTRKMPASDKKGMITVEVSVIVPVFLFIIAAMVWFLLFLLDMSLVICACQKEAVKCAELCAFPETESLISEEALSSRIGKVLTCGKEEGSSIKEDGHLIRVTAAIHTSIPLTGGGRYLGAGSFRYSYTAASASLDQEETIRKACRTWMEKR